MSHLHRHPIGELTREVFAGDPITASEANSSGPPWELTAGCHMAAGTLITVHENDGKVWPFFATGGIIQPGDPGTCTPADLASNARQRHIG